MKYTTYLFDFDYTLADSSRGIVICFRNVLQRHGYKDITDTAIKRTIGKTLEDSFSILTGITDMEQLIALKDEYSKEENQHMNRNTRLFADTLPTLHKLRQQGARIGIISTKNRFRIEEFMKIHLPQGWFDIIIGMEDVSCAKPDPEGLSLAIEKLKVSPEETLYIGDSIVDAQTAASAGVGFTGITSGMTKFEELTQYPHVRIISNLRELVSPPQNTFQKKIRHFIKKPKAYLRFIHIKQIRGRAAPPVSKELCTCRNCGNTFTDQYCNRCGQDRNIPRFTHHSAIRNVLCGMTNIDHGFGEGTIFEIGYLIGEEEYLNKGIGKLIVRKLEEAIATIGGKEIFADPDEKNIASIKTLLSNGFVRIKNGDYRKKIS